MDAEQRLEAIKGYDSHRIAELCDRYPIVSMQVELAGVDEEVTLQVELERDAELQHPYVRCPYFPKVPALLA